MNTKAEVDGAITRLRAAATRVEGGWLARDWNRVAADGSRTPAPMRAENIHFRAVCAFEEFKLEADSGASYEIALDLPAALHGVPIVGEPLQLIVNSLRPVDVLRDGERVFADSLPVVASGPALVTVVDRIREGANGTLRLEILATPVPLAGEWSRTGFTVQFTTPSTRAKWAVLDLAVARLILAAAFAETDAETGSLAAVARDLPTDLDSAPLDEVLAALEEGPDSLRSRLSWLDGVLADYRVHAIGHSHIDLAWLWTYDDTREVIFRDMTSVLALFDDYPEFRFTHSQARGYAEVEASRPDLFGRIVDRIAEGRLEPATLQWVEADANVPSGLGHARQISEGVDYSRASLGAEPEVFLAPDTFGHAGNLPQLAVQAGAKVYYHHRANPGYAVNARPWQAYWWVGDDGTRLLSLATPVYLGPISATRIANDLVALGKRNGITQVSYFYGVGDHGGGPTRLDLELIRRLDAAEGFPRIGCATVSDYADALLASGADLPEFHGESERVFEGCYVSHSDSKQMNRQSEVALGDAETLATLAGLDVEAAVSGAWRGILHHQFHDILGGSAVGGAFADQRADTDHALAVSADIAARALPVLVGGLAGGEVAVVNTLGTARHDLVAIPAADRGGATGVTDDAGNPVPSQVESDGSLVFLARVGPFATRRYRLTDAPSPTDADIRVEERTAWNRVPLLDITTPVYVARMRRDSGILIGLVDARTGRQLVGRGSVSPESPRQMRPDLGLGALVVTHELPHLMTSWVADDVDVERTLLGGAETTIVEHGPVRIVLETRHAIGESTATIRTILYAEVPWIEFEIDVDWREVGDPTAGVPGLAVTFGTRERALDLWAETLYGATRRDPDGYLQPMLRWVDLGSDEGGLAVANDSKYGVDALGPRLRIPLLRSAYDPDPASEAGRRDRSRFRVLPHAGSWREAGVAVLGQQLNHPLRTVTSAAPASSVALTPPTVAGSPGIVVDGLQTWGGVPAIRLYEAHGLPGEARLGGLPPGSRCRVLTITGTEVDTLDVGPDGSVELAFRPYQVTTIALDG
jgi:alpha-mannosidase